MDDSSNSMLGRRSFIKSLGLGTAALTTGTLAPFATSCSGDGGKEKEAAPVEEPPVLQIGDDIAVASTAYGRVKGYIMNGVYTFMGIPYGADTSGKNRFMPPVKPQPWDGILPTVFLPNSAPQNMPYPRDPNSYAAFVDHWNYDLFSEDCLRLNVWTNGLADGKKRPVIVWFHGGGYSNGNLMEQDGYHGENLAKQGDIVFCSVNHRLNAFGFSDLSVVGGEKYKLSGNVGALDMVAALEWIHENIANFGGDPENVTIIGQSGGGAKVCVLASMPQAKGLVHKAVALSGTAINGTNKKLSGMLGEYILKEAGLKKGEVDKLQELPWKDYLDIANRALSKMRQENADAAVGFSPVGDGICLPEGTFFSEPLPDAPDIPILFCTTFHEQSISRTDAALERMTKDEAVGFLQKRYGDQAKNIVDSYAMNFPDAKPVELVDLILSNRSRVVAAAEAKKHQTSPVYVAWFGWCPPLFDGRMRAFHCLDICFWFLNTDRMVTHTGGGERPRKLSKMMAEALLQFARTGDPNGGSLPKWDEFSVEKGETMILNDTCEMVLDPDRQARHALPQS